MGKIPVYFMPGLAASPEIFENIKLPEDTFEVYFLEWKVPEITETLQDYAKQMAAQIKHENPVLVGVSFGGILVQEIAEVIAVRKIIIISSVKCCLEFPRRMKFAKLVQAYRVFPTSFMGYGVDWLARYAHGNSFIARRLKLYEKYLSVRDKKYLDWAFKTVITWNRTVPNPKVVHIHGTADGVFPIKYLKDYIPVEGGTHIMIINRAKWLNEKLPEIILQDA